MSRADDPRAAPDEAADDGPLSLSVDDLAQSLAAGLGERVRIDPETIERDLARLVLALVELLRQLLEAQAIRRLENGRLTEEEEERLGHGLMRAREAVREVAARFGLSEADLRLELGPLGRIV